MRMSNCLVGLLCALVTLVAGAHGIMPTRLEAPSGSKLIGYQFTAVNYFDQSATYRIECFRNALAFPVPCLALPKRFTLRPNASRKFKVRLDTSGKDGLYFICSTFEPPRNQSTVVTRVCARFGVGVDAESMGAQPK